MQLGQRRYFSEKSTSRLRGNSACFKAEAPVLVPGLAPSERVGVFLPDHCQVGFAVMLIIVEFPFFADEVISLNLDGYSGFGW